MLTKNYIKQVRDLTGFTDYKIAKEYGINQSNFSKYSSGKSALSETHAFLIADILNINPTEVMINAKIENAKITNKQDKLEFWQQQLKNVNSIERQGEIEIVQFNPVLGDIYGNMQEIINICSSSNADMLIFPELAICGYPPEDLLLHQNFKQSIENAIIEIKKSSISIDIILGCPTFEDGKIYNSALLLRKGEITGTYHKQKLPNYGVFDEKRYFNVGDKPLIFNFFNKIYSLIICEDTWSQDVILANKNMGVDTIIGINASPYSFDKFNARIDKITTLAKQSNINIIYANMVGAQDSLVFDGGSFFINNLGEKELQLPFFSEGVFSLNKKYYNEYDEITNAYNSLVVGLRDYYQKSACFDGVIVALSGGIDSALTLAIANDALGNENIEAVMMPYIWTANSSLIDAKSQAEIMNINYKEIAINTIVDNYKDILGLSGIALENIQARVRGNIVMSIANDKNLLLLTTSNKSESAVGYTTLYGDMSGGFAPIKDVYKTCVYKLATYRNEIDAIIPQSVLLKPPSAELSPNQLDSNTLPPYDILDKILYLFIEKSNSIQQITDCGFEKSLVIKIVNMVKNNEYKRYQSALGTKFSEKAFDKERRYPMVNKFEF